MLHKVYIKSIVNHDGYSTTICCQGAYYVYTVGDFLFGCHCQIPAGISAEGVGFRSVTKGCHYHLDSFGEGYLVFRFEGPVRITGYYAHIHCNVDVACCPVVRGYIREFGCAFRILGGFADTKGCNHNLCKLCPCHLLVGSVGSVFETVNDAQSDKSYYCIFIVRSYNIFRRGCSKAERAKRHCKSKN